VKRSPVSNRPRLSDEVNRIVDDVSRDDKEKDAKAKQQDKSAYEINGVFDAGRPDFAKMSRNERLAYKQTLIQELRDLRFKYPELAIPEINHDLTVEEMYDIHYAALKHIVVKGSLSTWRMGLVVCWAAFELICTKGFGIPAEGYTLMMYEEMIRYEILLYRWREKKFTFATAEKDPLSEIMWCSLLNAGIIIAVNMIGKYFGSDLVSKLAKGIALPIASHVAHPKVNIPGVPNPTTEGGLLGAVEGGITKLVGMFASPGNVPTSSNSALVTSPTSASTTTSGSTVAASPPTVSKVEASVQPQQAPVFYDT